MAKKPKHCESGGFDSIWVVASRNTGQDVAKQQSRRVKVVVIEQKVCHVELESRCVFLIQSLKIDQCASMIDDGESRRTNDTVKLIQRE